MKKVQDHYFHLAKKEGYAARSVYKLQEANEKYHFIKYGQHVIDLGAYPGSWSQYVLKQIGKKGIVVGIDLNLPKIRDDNFRGLKEDVYSDFLPLIQDVLLFDVVLSDMAPATTGNKSVDHIRSIGLCERALEIAILSLREGGSFFCKVFQGGDFPGFVSLCKKYFKEVRIVKPKGSRSESVEIFVLGQGFTMAFIEKTSE